jgi:TonB-linked SusC/RagA family outer membrane protein
LRRVSWLIGGLLSGVVWAVDAQATWPSGSTPATHRAPSVALSVRQDTGSVLNRRITLDLHNSTLAAALDEVTRIAHLDLSYTDEVVPPSRHVTIKVTDITVREALKRLLSGTGAVVHESPSGALTLVKEIEKRSETLVDTIGVGAAWGRVVDSATARPLSGAIVSIRGTKLQVATNDSGFWAIQDVPAGIRVIVVRMLGFAPTERVTAVVDKQNVRVDFTLRMGMSRLQEVVTTATGQRRRLELGNDITVLNADSIVATQPITSVTDLLDGRVPGLTVLHSSGAPGDPARLRLRGTSSVYTNNDPIVIVDGARVYSAQSDPRSRNLTSGTYAAPSPLDDIDPQSIETIEVLKGPSAATLYGVDAANGVIVITTKRGRAGPPRWTATVDRGMTEMPGSYPESYLRWGHARTDNTPVPCPLTDFSCTQDSLVRFQLLNDPKLTVLGQGQRTATSLGVSGGSDALQYSVTGSYADEVGLIRLPGLEVDRYRATRGTSPPDWMQHPQQFTQWGATSRLTARLGDKADVSLTAMLSRSNQQRSSLEGQLGQLMSVYLDRTTGTYYQPALSTGLFGGHQLQAVDDFLAGYYTRLTDEATEFTNGVNLNLRPASWLTASADAGLNIIQRQDALLLPRGASQLTGEDSIGTASAGWGNSLVSTVNLRSTATSPLPWGFHLQLSIGANYTNQHTSDMAVTGNDLATGGSSVAQAAKILSLTELQQGQATFGWYVEPAINRKRFWLSTGLRFDGGTAFGAHASLAGFPKVSASYLISDEPFFPFKNIFNTLRLRAAYGQAGVQPGPAQRLRLYSTQARTWVDGQPGDATLLQALGNTELRPERSTEFEGGLDADLLDDRLSLIVSGYRKTRVDAIMDFNVPPSVYGANEVIAKNVGTIRNSGYELTLGTRLVRTDLVTWGAQLSVSHNQNIVVSLGAGVQPFGGDVARVVAGYPLFGRWGKPVLAYGDLNGDGVLEPNEVLFGDTSVYLGSPEPNYTAALNTTFSFLRGALTVNAGFTYVNGAVEQGPWTDERVRMVSRASNDPTTPLGEQAAALSSGTSDFLSTQVVNTLRFNSLSIAYNVSGRLAQRVGARALTVALQGTNLGLHSNYRGLDPDVGYGFDAGVLPQPRIWQVRVSANY